MQIWKNVLNGLLVIAAAAGMYLYIDNATEPENQPMSRDEYQAPQVLQAAGSHRKLMVADPPMELQEPALTQSES
jgi:hypothetical protein